jgi:serine phosphatase RsbU (regulator of sigma subunit)
MLELRSKISWYRSLAFKLFVIVSLLLFFSISTISWQNGKTFKGILSRQNEDNLLSANQRAASSFQESSLFWLSLGNAIVHMSSRGGETALRDAAEGILASNRGLASVQILEGSSEPTETLFRLTTIAAAELQGKDKTQMALALSSAGKALVKDEIKNTKATVLLRGVSDLVKAPILAIGAKLVTSSSAGEERNQKPKETWIVLGVWASSLASGLQRSEVFSSAVLDFNGKTLLKAVGDESKGLLVPVRAADLAGIAKGTIQFRTWSEKTEKQEPVLVTATRLGDFPLIAVSQKMSKQDELEVARQVRQILLWTWILFLVAVAVTYFAAGNVTRRILELLKSTMEIASGNFRVRLKVSSKDEVGHLSLAVNKMAEDIEGLMQVREVAIRQQTELRMAEDIQQTLIPAKVFERNGLKSVSYFKPANECAGDWWGRFSFGEGLELVVMADATGHGVHSALIAALAYSYFATLEAKISSGAIMGVAPDEILSGLNAVMYGAGKGVSTMTACVLLFDMNARKVHVANAGHCHPFVVRSSGAKSLVMAGDLIGFKDKVEVEKKVVDLRAGQRFLVYTDGLFECENSERDMIKKRTFRNFMSEGFVRPVEEFSQQLFQEVESFFGKHTMSDDITMVVLEVAVPDLESTP